MAAVFRRVKLNNEFHSAVKFSLTKRGNEQLKYESTNICCRLPHQIQREQIKLSYHSARFLYLDTERALLIRLKWFYKLY